MLIHEEVKFHKSKHIYIFGHLRKDLEKSYTWRYQLSNCSWPIIANQGFTGRAHMANLLGRRYSQSSVGRAASILEPRDRSKLLAITFVQVIMGFLDLVGVIAIGALGALSIQGVESHKPGNKVGSLLKILHLQNFSFQGQIAVLGISASMVLICKTIFSIYFTRKIFFFLSFKGSQISADLISKVLYQNLTDMQRRTTQEILYIVSTGVTNLLIGIVATIINIVTDIAMFFIISIGLFAVDPIIALVTSILFFAIAYILHQLLQVRAREFGIAMNKLTVNSNEKILEVLNSYRETVVHHRRHFYADEIQKLRYKLGSIQAEQSFQPLISKYVIELSAVLGALGLAGYEFSTKNAVHAVAVIAVFMAASSRIAPGALRIQQGFLLLKNSIGAATSTLSLIDEFKNIKILSEDLVDPTFDYPGFSPDIVLSSVSFKYKSTSNFALTDINLYIKQGTSTAFVGPSGAGKTTLIDLILGVLEPDSGNIHISGVNPAVASEKWPGAISYVPQNVVIAAGSIRDNVALGYSQKVPTNEQIWAALDLAQLNTAISQLPETLDTLVGEGGSRISGGQRQRLGIARALFTRPKLLVLDEATSSLDGQTEASISKSISKLSGKVTVIVVAHRLSTVRSVDQVIYMEKGQIVAVGSFDEVRSRVPDFDRQASLMGL